ncbi:Uncharacterised protein [Bordetella pertussis]|nr:Uncharacterised protein [Bordetella pertussis]CFW44020.1 Uncharacterised protein [Bordetella pertussis]
MKICGFTSTAASASSISSRFSSPTSRKASNEPLTEVAECAPIFRPSGRPRFCAAFSPLWIAPLDRVKPAPAASTVCSLG